MWNHKLFDQKITTVQMDKSIQYIHTKQQVTLV
jgi:hypothetical protein